MIHKTSIIDPKANISSKANIGPFCIIGPNVIIEDEVVIHAQVNINGNTKIGSGSIIYPFASIGNDPQDLKYNGEKNSLIIGSNNKIREYVSINPGTVGGGGQTKIGDNCLFMVSSHVAHDCLIGNNVVFANNVAVGGHVRIDDDVVVGGNSAIQQFTRIGKMAMIGGMCGVVKDVIPYGMAFGNRCSLQGLNLIGLRRKNITNKEILLLSEAYKEIFKTENLSKNLLNLNQKFNENYLIKEVIHFINKDKKRPICTPYSK
jgi:UDP-N-acetylglucosamine acyltransferase